MRSVREVSFEEVLRVYRAHHPHDLNHPANTNREGEDTLRLADRMFGIWHHVRLTRAEARAVVLPWHLSEGGGVELVPPTGLTVAETVERLREGGEELRRANPVCSAKIDLLSTAEPTPVHVSTAPVEHAHYARVLVGDGLVHLDGLHRLLARELSGALDPAEGVEAYVAGDPASPGGD